jgi:hypothetical protein
MTYRFHDIFMGCAMLADLIILAYAMWFIWDQDRKNGAK